MAIRLRWIALASRLILRRSKEGDRPKRGCRSGGGSVLAVFMTDNGAGYRSSIQPSAPVSGAEPDPAIIPLFSEGGPDQLEKGLVKVITGGAGWVAPDKE